MEKNNEEFESPYCEICGHCGYTDCCGIIGFLNEHVKGKTNCKHEEQIIEELIWLFENVGKENEQLKKEKQEVIDYVNHPDFIDWHIGVDEGLYRRKDILNILKGDD